jgi:protein SCO1/2
MQSKNNHVDSARLRKCRNTWNSVVSAIAAGMLIGSVTVCTNAMAEDQTDHSMHNMHDMHHMEHMDHSMHEQQMAERGAYKISVMPYNIPDVKLLDRNGKKVSLRKVLDDHSPVMLNFIFTTCTTICPVMSSTFQQVQEKLGPNQKDVRLVSISIDPENDTPAKLKEYAGKYKAGEQWMLLTGSIENSLAVQKAFDVFAGEKMNHKPITFIKAKGADRWVRMEGLVEAEQVLKEYEKLVK